MAVMLLDSLLSNCSNIPIEAMESDYPFFGVGL